ncbi:MAG: tetratricopeptide repeat protein [Alphaproteobacteria bacterium]|nr:tetratricopeptide repeat protein [Alphaproteobacteria bacterium]
MAQLENELAESQARIEQLEEFVRVQGQSQATRLENLDQVNSEVTNLRGRIEVLEFELTTLKDGFADYQLQMERRQLHDERRLRAVETMLGVKPPPPPTDAELGVAMADAGSDGTPPDGTPPDGTTTDPPDETGDIPDTVQGKLELAATRLEEGSPAVARAILLRASTEHADAPEIDEVHFRIADTYYAEKDYRKAAFAYKKVMDDHPKSVWVSWALLRQGECFEGLGQEDNAKLFYDGVIQRFPKSDAAKEAKKKLGR